MNPGVPFKETTRGGLFRGHSMSHSLPLSHQQVFRGHNVASLSLLSPGPGVKSGVAAGVLCPSFRDAQLGGQFLDGQPQGKNLPPLHFQPPTSTKGSFLDAAPPTKK